jgi:UDP-N-acetylglucosamine 3-dehydrogenase
MAQPKVVVVGTGSFGKNHVRVLSELGALAGVIDINEAIARSFGQLHRVPWSTSVADFDLSGVDGAVISTPTTTHFGIAKELISRGIGYLFMEKPVVTDVKEALELAEIIEGHGTKLMCGFIERFNQGVVQVKDYLREGRIGDPIIMATSRIRQWPDRPIDLGVIKDVAIHDIDIVRYLSEEMPTSVYALAGSLTRRPREDHATIVLHFERHRAILEANWITPSKSRKLTVTGMAGFIEADLITQEVTVRDDKGAFTKAVVWKEPLLFELKHFLQSIADGSEPSLGMTDALSNLLLAEAALVSSQSNRSVSLDEILGRYEGHKLKKYLRS